MKRILFLSCLLVQGFVVYGFDWAKAEREHAETEKFSARLFLRGLAIEQLADKQAKTNNPELGARIEGMRVDLKKDVLAHCGDPKKWAIVALMMAYEDARTNNKIDVNDQVLDRYKDSLAEMHGSFLNLHEFFKNRKECFFDDNIDGCKVCIVKLPTAERYFIKYASFLAKSKKDVYKATLEYMVDATVDNWIQRRRENCIAKTKEELENYARKTTYADEKMIEEASKSPRAQSLTMNIEELEAEIAKNS